MMIQFVAADALSLVPALSVPFDWSQVTRYLPEGAGIVYDRVMSGRTWQSAYTEACRERFDTNRACREHGEKIGIPADIDIMAWEDDDDDRGELLQEAIDVALNETLHTCVHFRLQGMKLGEIAREFNTTEKTICVWLQKATELIRAYVDSKREE